MSAPDIRVDTVVKTGDSRFGQNGLGEDFSYLHTKYYNGNYPYFVAPSFIEGD
jgi:hypothetical protein